jgi:hypothetical protein
MPSHGDHGGGDGGGAYGRRRGRDGAGGGGDGDGADDDDVEHPVHRGPPGETSFVRAGSPRHLPSAARNLWILY